IKMTDATGGPSGMAVTSFFFSSGVNPFVGTTATSVTNAIALSGGQLVASNGTTPITSAATPLTSVYDTGTDKLDNGDIFTFAGTRVNGAVAALTFTVGPSGTTVQSLLTALENAYGVNPGDVTATLDSTGHIRLVDNTAQGMMAPSLTSTTQHTAATPFGAAGARTSPFASGAMTDISTGSVAIGTSTLTNVFVGGNAIALGDVISFAVNTDAGGNVIGAPARNFTVGVTGNTITDLTNWMDDIFADGAVGGATLVGTATLNGFGVINVADAGNDLVAALTYTPNAAASTPLGAGGAFALSNATTGGQINITTAKQQVVSTARAVTTAGGTTPINGTTPLTSVFDAAGVALTATDALTFVGVRGDNTPVNATFTAGTSFGSPLIGPNSPPTVQDLLSWLEAQFNAEASIDGAGRLVLTDRKADEVATLGYHSKLAVTSIANPAAGVSLPFGGASFATIAADTSGEDGSRAGGNESINFSTEALSTTQYANSSTTIFQDQNGFAAGFLQSVSVDTTGVITGNYSNGQVLQRAQVALASFNNLAGLRKEGGNVFRETTASGAPITGPPTTNGLGSISPNSLEQSNVDLGAEFVKLITTQRGFQANSKIITTTDEMLADLINIKR
ncbi:MAG: flagellar hook-basal body complex protein, partial [Desulfobulbaceae bacterium]|nr:flagellar hook-basal body complex protein [Desulfobulbaceae bacterium]